uniref:Uncharacterized protein n=1 Tax=Glossina austeni TaxID=7395 RepID=A0A1A9VGC3_GLOAU
MDPFVTGFKKPNKQRGLYDGCCKEQVSLLIDHRGRHAPGNKIDDTYRGNENAQDRKGPSLAKSEQARTHVAADRMLASEDIFVFSFDLQTALPFPKLTTSIAYYKRNLDVYNFGCHEFYKNISHMFVWPKTEESRGSHEISSCLVNLLKLLQSTEIQAECIEMKFLTIIVLEFCNKMFSRYLWVRFGSY